MGGTSRGRLSWHGSPPLRRPRHHEFGQPGATPGPLTRARKALTSPEMPGGVPSAVLRVGLSVEAHQNWPRRRLMGRTRRGRASRVGRRKGGECCRRRVGIDPMLGPDHRSSQELSALGGPGRRDPHPAEGPGARSGPLFRPRDPNDGDGPPGSLHGTSSGSPSPGHHVQWSRGSVRRLSRKEKVDAPPKQQHHSTKHPNVLGIALLGKVK